MGTSKRRTRSFAVTHDATLCVDIRCSETWWCEASQGDEVCTNLPGARRSNNTISPGHPRIQLRVVSLQTQLQQQYIQQLEVSTCFQDCRRQYCNSGPPIGAVPAKSLL
ncbi:hypothetical protein F441_02614 [Phytophthora nicotianae CJ01A1]|uniref:Uncharacterized protein n=6 Tax=Phytophthora nicotianae TaxID=4792 RepID=W2PDJ5_PHYN3|nr:hypothetical protein PPTG_24555 [Phytophthora nicotianae INRA-310]ETI54517.1 hypothetical protein F443_02652 [Phytophthora nicotianae P1569]ETK94414.1 hypothetical protein L915_02534 [Phytophthora nicotianae]ETO83269.1 hypothetical protein F444_02653 [Phytophthora nicotianae P1976]ETP24348.1 hypothetical protein F441_02614 [Phytophthora nicotianae CJ01A1]ETP52322.1 hypothetical protein F442_02625 [Phytophthora nicotianae P10297]